MNGQVRERKKERSRVSVTTDMSEGLCIGCGQNNPFGLKLSFKWDGKTARAEYTPHKFHQGWPNIVHGGIITTMLDDAMGNATVFSGFSDFLTANIQVNFKRPALVGEPLVITASLTRRKGKFIWVKADVSLPDGTLVAEGKATQVLVRTNSDDTSSKEEKSQLDV
ncbi:PaaI family thioesterase [Chloroflexota bacterium]